MGFPRILAATAVCLALGVRPVLAIDCDDDGVDDSAQIAADPTLDCNRNGLLDSCDLDEPRIAFPPPIEAGFDGDAGGLWTADLDGDGGRDLLADTGGPEGLRVLRDGGDGTFTADGHVPDAAPGEAWQRLDVAVADFDGDGDADVASIGVGRREVRIAFGRRDGPFEAGSSIGTGATLPRVIAAANVDGAGGVDLVVGAGSDVLVYLGRGDGTFEPPRRVDSERADPAENLVAADFDGDGDDDVAVVFSRDDRILVYTAADGGALTDVVTIPVGVVYDLAAGDLDGDGAAELIVAQHGNPLPAAVVYRRETDGRFTSGRPIGSQESTTTQRVAADDFDGDGTVDLAGITFDGWCEYPTGAIWVLRGAGVSRLDPPVAEFPRQPLFVPLASRATGMATADFDRDGRADIAILRAAGTEGTRSALEVRLSRVGFDSADCNDDGVPDECQLTGRDCDGNGVPDECQLVNGDADGNGLLDACDRDCDEDGEADHIELENGAEDCNADGVPDECQLATLDRDQSGALDECEIAADPSVDCNRNGVPDEVDLRDELRLRSSPSPLFGPSAHGAALVDLGVDGSVGLAVVAGGGCCPLRETSLRLYAWRDGAFTPLGVGARLPAPASLRVADFDRDGLDDLILLEWPEYCRGAVHLQVVPALAPGQFGTPVEFVVEANGGDFAVADFDRDGVPDAAVLTGEWREPGAVRVLSGADGFLVAADLPLPRTPTAIDAADLDGDGDIDLAVAVLGSDLIGANGVAHVFLNDGSGDFDAGPTLLAPRSVSDVLAADFDDDGVVDLALHGLSWDSLGGEETAAVRIHRGAGDGTFAAGGEIVQNTYAGRIVAADFDADGRTDVAIAAGWNADPDTEPNSIVASVHLRRSALEYAEPRHWLVGGETTRALLAHDFDGDGLPELAVGAEYLGRLTVLANRGGGAFAAPIVDSVSTDRGVSRLVPGDLDGDGRDEFVAVYWSVEEVSVLRRRGGDGLVTVQDIAVAGFARSVLLTTVDADPWLDAVLATTSGLYLLRGRGDGRLSPPEVVLETEDLVHTVTGDFDGDGDTDIVATVVATLALFEGDGAGGFAPPVTVWERDRWPTSLVAADVNGDGMTDLAAARFTDNRTRLEVHLAPDFAAVPLGIGVAPFVTSLAAGDADGDGAAELAIASGQGGIAVVGIDEGGALVEHARIEAVSFGWPVAFADLRGDGRDDLLAGGTDHVWLAENTSRDGVSFAPARPIGASSDGASLLFAADIDGDGDREIVYHGDIAEGADALVTIVNDSAPTSFDVDGDGLPDECLPGRDFQRGDADANGRRDITDAVRVLLFLFAGEAPPPCTKAADANDDGVLDIADPIYTLEFLFLGGRALPEPLGCGRDRTADALGCEAFDPCGA